MDVRFPALAQRPLPAAPDKSRNSPEKPPAASPFCASSSGDINPPEVLAGHGKSKDSPAKIKEAALQFEAILINQMLQSSRASDREGWMGAEEDQNSTLTDFGEQQFAQALASSGGLGIAKMIIADLNRHANR